MVSIYVERDCAIEHNGQRFESGGAVVTPERITAYLGKGGVLTDWHGNTLGKWRITSSWRINSYMSDRMHQVYANVDGVEYTGRSLGEGMIFNGKARK